MATRMSSPGPIVARSPSKGSTGCRAFICGVSGPALTDTERDFIRAARPWGFILFKRNIENPAQVADLTRDLRSVCGHPDAPVLVDQEGGRVQRLGPPLWPAYPRAEVFGALWERDPLMAREAAWLNARLMAHDLHAVGIDVDCLPVLDLRIPQAHEVIGGRSYGARPDAVAQLGRAVADGMIAGGVLPVMKHMPGHGRSSVDTHFALPRVSTSRRVLMKSDLVPFIALRDLPMGMTGHLIFEAFDPDAPATTSRKVISRIIRRAIGFDGLLMTDDLSMQALAGTLGERAAAARAAGVDMLLHCTGNLDEMDEVAREAPVLSGAALRRARAALARKPGLPEALDVEAARERLAGLMATA
jgi:beta-N-acetylhexosaminidase